eukprot:296200-Chlamydomonas_euryale.AAC.3
MPRSGVRWGLRQACGHRNDAAQRRWAGWGHRRARGGSAIHTNESRGEAGLVHVSNEHTHMHTHMRMHMPKTAVACVHINPGACM